jgi:hypothetical protein
MANSDRFRKRYAIRPAALRGSESCVKRQEKRTAGQNYTTDENVTSPRPDIPRGACVRLQQVSYRLIRHPGSMAGLRRFSVLRTSSVIALQLAVRRATVAILTRV